MDGILIVNKEKGFTSFDVVAKLRGILGEKRIGHLGTLDPEAEGVLPICLGRATRLAELLSGGDKVYRTTLLLGVETDTQDTTGRLIKRGEVIPPEEEIRRVIEGFVGKQMQLPPMVSAKKVDGKKLVDLARQGKTAERKPVPITIYSIEILDMNLPRVQLRIRCSKGSYIRTLCHDMGERLGCGGTMETLIREEACGYRLADALYLDQISSLSLTGGLKEKILSLEQVLEAFPAYHCLPGQDKLAENGNTLSPVKKGGFSATVSHGDLVRVKHSQGRLLGLYRYDEKDSRLLADYMLGPQKEEQKRAPRPTVVSVGKFDGVHLGHQAILQEVVRQAEAEKLDSLVLSFTNAPELILLGTAAGQILPAREKSKIIKEMGIRKLVEARFTDALRDMSAEAFLEDILLGRFGMKKIVAGPDVSFGKDRRGNIDFLHSRAASIGFDVTVVEKLRHQGEIISSTYIKKLLTQGRMEEAAACLGRPYSLEAFVTYGASLGRQLGFPTMNMEVPADQLLPPRGVYASRSLIDGLEIWGMSNLGVRPSVTQSGKLYLETHLFDYSGNLYGKRIRTELLSFIRPEDCFSDKTQLEIQLKQDQRRVRELLGI